LLELLELAFAPQRCERHRVLRGAG
jgi:hypothetical protein